MVEDVVVGALFAFCFAAVCTPVGVSGAVFLVPVQVSVLETPSPALTPTNLLYNLIAIPGALWRFRSQGRLGGPLIRMLVLGTLPGVVAGAVIRVEWLSGPEAFYLVIAAVLAPLGAWLAFGHRPRERSGPPARTRPTWILALAVGVVGGIYGIGGGSILAPILVGLGFAVAEVAPAALAATFLTSVAGVITSALLSIGAGGEIAPDWLVGLGLGLGGLAGSFAGVALQDRLSEGLLRRGLGLLALVLGVRYGVLGLT
jgi:uncharacterized membrane protein YfcA